MWDGQVHYMLLGTESHFGMLAANLESGGRGTPGDAGESGCEAETCTANAGQVAYLSVS